MTSALPPRNPQLEFFEADPVHCDWLIAHLEGRGWQTAADILRAIGKPPRENCKRALRAYAEASGGRIASGQQGYKLTQDMTLEEFNHFDNWFGSQIGKMQKRRIEVRNVFYGRKVHIPA